MTKVLDVRLGGRTVGTLTLLTGERALFAFIKDYIDEPERPTLSLSFKDELGALITDVPYTRARLPPFFANLLPEGAMRAYLAARAGVKPDREWALLAVLGRDLAGAVTVAPAGERFAAHDDDDGDERLAASPNPGSPLRFSLAGTQRKFPAVADAAGRLTIPADGIGGTWIVKLPSPGFDGLPENEFTMLTLARAIGIDAVTARLVDINAIADLPAVEGTPRGQALAVERFDRHAGGGPIHSEDFAQIYGVYPEEKYDRATYRHLAEVLSAEIGGEGVAEFVRRIVFNALIGNADMHLKNWSLVYPGGRRARFAPGYDFVATIAWQECAHMALKLARSKRFDELSMEALAYFAARGRLPERLVLDTARETVERFREVWAAERRHLALSRASVTALEKHFAAVPLVQAPG